MLSHQSSSETWSVSKFLIRGEENLCSCLHRWNILEFNKCAAGTAAFLAGAEGVFIHPGAMSLPAAEPVLPALLCPHHLALWKIIGFVWYFSKANLNQILPFHWFKQTKPSQIEFCYVFLEGLGGGIAHRDIFQSYVRKATLETSTYQGFI